MLKFDRDRPKPYRILPDGKLHVDESMTFVCGNCEDATAGPCFVCETAGLPRVSSPSDTAAKAADAPDADGGVDVTMVDGTAAIQKAGIAPPGEPEQLMFRCSRCRRGCHYAHCE